MSEEFRHESWKDIAQRALSEERSRPSLGEMFSRANEVEKEISSFARSPKDFDVACSEVLGMSSFTPDWEKGYANVGATSEMELMARMFITMLKRFKDTPERPAKWDSCLKSLGFGIIDCDTANAFAFKHKREYYIAVTSGLLFRLHSLFALAMSNRKLFPRIRDKQSHIKDIKWKWADLSLDDPKCFQKTYQQLCELYDEEERDLEREGREQNLVFGAFNYILGHEWGHIVSGHLDFRESCGLKAVCSERVDSSSATPVSESQVGRAMEMDGDLLSLSFMGMTPVYNDLMNINLRASDRDDRVKHSLQHLDDFLTGSLSSLLLFEENDKSLSRESSTHPHPLVRFESLCHHVMQPANQGSWKVIALGPLDVLISQIYPDVLAMAKTLKLPQARIIDGISNSDLDIISSTFSGLMKDVADLRVKLSKR
jgi:hypothetical protein